MFVCNFSSFFQLIYFYYINLLQNVPVRCNTVGVPPGPGGSSYPQQPLPGSSAPGPGPPASSYPPHPQPPSSPSHQQQQPATPQQYQPYPQRYPTPPNVSGGPPQQSSPVRVPAYPAPHHQVRTIYIFYFLQANCFIV